MGVKLVSYAARRRAGMEAREEEDKVNDFGRDPIGEGRDERVRLRYRPCVTDSDQIQLQEYNRGLKTLLVNTNDDMTPVPDIGEKVSNDTSKRRPKLEELTRFTMVKRIW